MAHALGLPGPGRGDRAILLGRQLPYAILRVLRRGDCLWVGTALRRKWHRSQSVRRWWVARWRRCLRGDSPPAGVAGGGGTVAERGCAGCAAPPGASAAASCRQIGKENHRSSAIFLVNNSPPCSLYALLTAHRLPLRANAHVETALPLKYDPFLGRGFWGPDGPRNGGRLPCWEAGGRRSRGRENSGWEASGRPAWRRSESNLVGS